MRQTQPVHQTAVRTQARMSALQRRAHDVREDSWPYKTTRPAPAPDPSMAGRFARTRNMLREIYDRALSCEEETERNEAYLALTRCADKGHNGAAAFAALLEEDDRAALSAEVA